MRTQSVGSFFGFQRGRACAIRATGAGIGLIDLILSDLAQARSLGSFGCSVFLRGALEGRRAFSALVLSEMAKVHQKEDRRPRDHGGQRVEGKRLIGW